MTNARRFLVPTMAVVALGLVPLSSAAQPAFDGIYIARGLNSEGHQYRRAVEIARDGDGYSVSWVEMRVTDEALILEPTWFGVGIATGATLSVSFVAGETFGIVVYEAGQDGELSGRWRVVGDDGAVHSETLTRLPDPRPEPAEVDPRDEPKRPPPSASRTLHQVRVKESYGYHTHE